MSGRNAPGRPGVSTSGGRKYSEARGGSGTGAPGGRHSASGGRDEGSAGRKQTAGAGAGSAADGSVTGKTCGSRTEQTFLRNAGKR